MISTAKEMIVRLQPEFDKTRQKLSVARHLPGAVYSSADIYALEKEKIFMTRWLSVARVEEVANVGDYMTFSVMGESIVIAHPSAAEIVVYMNQCLHRGWKSRAVAETAWNLAARTMRGCTASMESSFLHRV